MSALVSRVCSVARTKRGRWFWAAWWTGAPAHSPFRRPDASDGAAATREQALRAAEARAGVPLTEIDALWARAWMRVLRGHDPWPSRASREPAQRERVDAPGGGAGVGTGPSVWETLGVSPGVTDEELKAAYRRRVLETHPDQGGDASALRRVVRAYAEARRRLARPRRRRAARD